jgi:4-amino-4-deoxy-L-arabinose transferase-like glycosyltransferase
LLCALVYLLLAPQQRKKLPTEGSLVAGVVALLFFLPNIIWNMRNDFPTFSHTAANASLGTELFNPGNVVDFLVDQVGLFGPILFFCLLWGALSLFRLRKAGGQVDQRSLFLLSFSFPILLFVLVLSFVSRANANWAATAYISACIFVIVWLTQGRRIRALYASFTLHMVLMVALSALILAPSLIEKIGLDNAFKRVRGWNLMTSEVLDLAGLEPKAQSILADNRLILTELLYYGRHTDLPLFIWDYNGRVQNHYEMTVTLPRDAKDPILLVARNDNPQPILRAFESVEFVKRVTVPIGGNRTREVFVYRLEGFDGE